jgi:hypothetical protein
MSELPRFRPDLLLGALLDGGVRFVIVGGLAAQAHGSPSLTGDLDICHAIDRHNLDRLAAVLDELAAVRRGSPGVARTPLDRRALRAADVLMLSTRHGDLDLLAHPDPRLDFHQLAPGAVTTEIMGRVVLVAGLDDLMAMKRAAGRPKDLIELEILGAVREEIDRRPG